MKLFHVLSLRSIFVPSAVENGAYVLFYRVKLGLGFRLGSRLWLGFGYHTTLFTAQLYVLLVDSDENSFLSVM